jgi:hypothetical protein
MSDWERSMAAMGMKRMEMEGGPMATSSAPTAYLVEAFAAGAHLRAPLMQKEGALG